MSTIKELAESSGATPSPALAGSELTDGPADAYSSVANEAAARIKALLAVSATILEFPGGRRNV
jgi:hypothetical protein